MYYYVVHNQPSLVTCTCTVPDIKLTYYHCTSNVLHLSANTKYNSYITMITVQSSTTKNKHKHSTVQYCTVPYCTVLYCTVLYCTVFV